MDHLSCKLKSSIFTSPQSEDYKDKLYKLTSGSLIYLYPVCNYKVAY